MVRVIAISSLLFLNTVVFTALGLFSYRRKLLVGGRIFSLLMVCLAVYCFGGAMVVLGDELGWMLAWNNVIYLGLVWTGPLWFLLASRYAGNRLSGGLWLPAVLFLVPLATLIAKYHPGLSHWVYRDLGINENGIARMLSFTRGPLSWIQVSHNALTILAGTVLIVKTYFQSSPPYRRQAALMFWASLIPLVLLLLYLPKRFLSGIDFIPFGFILTALLFAIGLLRHNLFEHNPITWRGVMQALGAALIVVDAGGRVVELNSGARRLLPTRAETGKGRSWEELVTAIPALEAITPTSNTVSLELTLDTPEGPRGARALVSPIFRSDGNWGGQTLLLLFQPPAERPLQEVYSPDQIERDAVRLARGMDTQSWYLDSSLTLTLLAQKSGIPRNRLSAVLNLRFKKNFNDFVNSYRVEEAKRILLSSPMNILEVGYAAGFNSKATFYTAFRKHTGLNPGTFKASRKG